MIDGIGQLGATPRLNGPTRPTAETRPAFRLPDSAKDSGFPATPPTEVLASLDKAARVIEELASKRVNLHFEVDDHTNTVRVEVRDGHGNVVRQIPTSKALDVLAGDHAGLTFDGRG
jgi:hypothetical protein